MASTPDTNLIKHLYEIQRDHSSIDNLLIELRQELGDQLQAISVRGLSAGNSASSFEQLPYGFKQKIKGWCRTNPVYPAKEYAIKLYLDHTRLSFRVCNMEWVTANGLYAKATVEDFNYNCQLAYDITGKVCRKLANAFQVSVFCGHLPQSTWSFRCYVNLLVRLPVTAIDVFTHCTKENLTMFGRDYIHEVGIEFCQLVHRRGELVLKLYTDKTARNALLRKAENVVRQKNGLKNVGDAFVNETLLAHITRKFFPDTVRQYRTKWLENFVIDIYIPSRRVAIEYHGIQHYEPIERFGGADKFAQQQARDQYVRKKCKEKGVLLLEWPYLNKVTEGSVREWYVRHVGLNDNIAPGTLF
jgi:hypothetical protein